MTGKLGGAFFFLFFLFSLIVVRWKGCLGMAFLIVTTANTQIYREILIISVRLDTPPNAVEGCQLPEFTLSVTRRSGLGRLRHPP